MLRRLLLEIVLLALGLMAARASARKPREGVRERASSGPAARLSQAPASARALKNPYEGDENAKAAGRKLYMRHCAECHGEDGYGDARAANFHSPVIQAAPPGALFWAIRNGRLPQGMPAWSNLPDQQKWQLVVYLKSLK